MTQINGWKARGAKKLGIFSDWRGNDLTQEPQSQAAKSKIGGDFNGKDGKALTHWSGWKAAGA